MRVVGKILAVGILAVGAAMMVATPNSRAQTAIADAPGKDTVVKLCSMCHWIGDVITMRKDRAGWELTVSNMKGFGATFSDEEGKVVVEYLTANYGLK